LSMLDAKNERDMDIEEEEMLRRAIEESLR
jgi:hypothetical protein